MKLLLIYHDTSSLPRRVLKLQERSKGCNIEVEVVQDLKYLTCPKKSSEYDGILFDYATIPHISLIELVKHFFPNKFVLVLSETADDEEEKVFFEEAKLPNMYLVSPDLSEILELLYMEHSLTCATQSIKLVMNKVSNITERLSHYGNSKHKTSTQE